MSKFNSAILKFGSVFAVLAFTVGVASSRGCFLFFHQPKVPENMGKLMNKSK